MPLVLSSDSFTVEALGTILVLSGASLPKFMDPRRITLTWLSWPLAGSPKSRRKGTNLFYRQQHHRHMWRNILENFPFYYQDIPDKRWDPSVSHFNTGRYPPKRYVHCPLFTDIWVVANSPALWYHLWIKHKIDFPFRIVHYGTFHNGNIFLLRPHTL